MDLGIAGKRALVTGSTAGIGFATARALAREGARVILNGRTQARVRRGGGSASAPAVPGADVGGVAADLGTAAGCAAVIARCPTVDILVNNLGIFEPKPFEEIPDEDWLRFFEVNVLSGVRLARHYLPGMRARELGPDRLRLERVGAADPAEMIHYGMTKTAQLAVARGLAETLAGTGVTVNSVLPGPDRLGRRGRLRRQTGAAQGMDAASDGARVLRAARARPRSSSASPRRTRWPR